MNMISRGNFHLRDSHILQAIGLHAALAVEMRMPVVIVILVVAEAELVSLASASILDHVHEMMVTEGAEGAEDV